MCTNKKYEENYFLQKVNQIFLQIIDNVIMLWDPASDEKDGEGEQHNVPVTPILVPLQNTPTTTEQNVPLLVPDVQGLKDQFQQQQNMLTQIKETLKQNESQLYSKEKQVEVNLLN